MAEVIRTQVATSSLRERARIARLRDDWPEVAMFESLADELDELRALAADVVDVPHFIEFTEDGWSIEHPYACRSNGTRLLDCEIHQHASALNARPPQCAPGRYRLELHPETGLAIDLESHEEVERC